MIQNIDQIKAAAKIHEVINTRLKLKKKGSDYVACCPFHNEKTPSFTVSPARDIFKCFGCGKSGDAIAFLMDLENLNYPQAIKEVAKIYNIEVDQSNSTNYEKPTPRLEKLSAAGIKYFEQRGISNNTLLRFNITESVEWMPKANKEIPAICFNYIRDGELINIKYRAKDKDFKLHKNAELIFYNIDALQGENTAIIVEGEIDCLSLYEAGIYNVVSVPNGASTGNMQLKYLDNCWQHFEGIDNIYLFMDNDEPGNMLRDELARRLGRDRCYKVEYPKDCKDANDVLVKYGRQAIAHMIEYGKRWPIDGIISVDDVYSTVLDYYKNGYPKGADAGIGDFDNYLTFVGGQVTIVTGAPNSGKSEFLDWIITQLAKRHNWKFSLCSFENPISIHVTKLMQKFIGKAFDFRKDPYNRMDQDEFEESIIMTDNYFNFINIAQVEVTVTGLLNKLREVVLKTGIKGVVIDPWNYLEHKIPHGYTETQYISESLTLIKEFAVKNDVHIFIVAHPKKMTPDLKTGKSPVVTMYDIAGSAHFFNKADNGISVHRTEQVDVYIQKVRFEWLGKQGFVSFSYDTFKRKYNQI